MNKFAQKWVDVCKKGKCIFFLKFFFLNNVTLWFSTTFEQMEESRILGSVQKLELHVKFCGYAMAIA